MNPLLIRKELLRRGVRTFTSDTFTRIFRVPSYIAKYILETRTKEGLFARLKQGVYTLKTDLPSEEELANALYRPSYISLEYALAYYGILPEMPYTVTSVTTKPTRLFTCGHNTFSYRTIKHEAYTGYVLKKEEERAFFIAEPEKAIVDYLYFVSLRKSPYNERLINTLVERKYYKPDQLRRNRVIEYTCLYNRKSLNTLIRAIFKTV